MDNGDNDPARFLRYLFAALERVGVKTAGIENERSQGLQVSAPILAGLINDLAAHPQEVVLVLDDYHIITSQLVHDAMAYLLEHLPDNLHLVVASRADPPLPLARLRARGELAELRLAELRFSLPEAAAFLNQAMGLGLSAAEIHALVNRTEGWISGLQMAAISLLSQPEPGQFIQDSAGSNRYVMDHLLEEVLQRRTMEEKNFLMHTSILETMCGSLCEAVVPGLPEGGGQAMLERLERANLFILPLDNRRAWYRYHRLFADLLARQLTLEMPARVSELQRRASVWYEENGLKREAIGHALAARDFKRAAGLIERTAEETIMHSQAATLLNWVNALPASELRAYPMLGVYHAWALLSSGKPLKEIETALEAIEHQGEVPASRLKPLRAYLELMQGHTQSSFQQAQQALLELPEENRFLRTVSSWIISLQPILSGDYELASKRLEEVIHMSRQAGNVLVRVMALCTLGDQFLSLGPFGLAKETYQRALDLAVDPKGEPIPVSGVPLTRLAEIFREQNLPAQAEEMLLDGIETIGCYAHR